MNNLKPSGSNVKVSKLQSTIGMIVHSKHLDCRMEGGTGVTNGYVPGHGGDVLWVTHIDSSVGAYAVSELEVIDSPSATNIW